MDIKKRLSGCLIYGAIGDALGSRYEGQDWNVGNPDFDFHWSITDDTQLTIATCEAIFDAQRVDPKKIAENFLYWFNNRKLTGLGPSTLKALRELQMGGHWALVGNTGEYAAGNGAAMRIAPLAFKSTVDRQMIKDVCSITHKNDEAYAGALAIYYSIMKAIQGDWKGDSKLIELIIDEIPDTRVKDRLVELCGYQNLSIREIGKLYKPTGYVVDAVAMSIFAASKIEQIDIREIFKDLILVGGDTDTVCSMTGQIVGALIGSESVQGQWLEKYNTLGISETVERLVQKWTI